MHFVKEGGEETAFVKCVITCKAVGDAHAESIGNRIAAHMVIEKCVEKKTCPAPKKAAGSSQDSAGASLRSRYHLEG